MSAVGSTVVTTTTTAPLPGSTPISTADATAKSINSPHGGSNTPYMMIAIAILLIITFVAIVLAYVYLYPDIRAHQVTVVNNCTTTLQTVLIADGGNDNFIGLNGSVAPGQSVNFFVSPGWKGYVAGSTTEGVSSFNNNQSGFTQALLGFAGDSNGSVKMGLLNPPNLTVPLLAPTLSGDEYAISLRQGYNLPIAITPGSNTSGPSCTPATMVSVIDSTECPTELQILDSNGNYIACNSACGAGLGDSSSPSTDYCCADPGTCGAPGACSASWIPITYFTTFDQACPNCLISNCDVPLTGCASTSATVLSDYTITFCPNLS